LGKYSKTHGKQLAFRAFLLGLCSRHSTDCFYLAITLGSYGEKGRDFFSDFQQASNENIGSAIIGGIIFNAANILLTAAMAIAGMSVAFPVGIGLALVIGVIVNYLDHPLGNGILLTIGVGLITLAILLNAKVYRTSSASNKVSTKGLALSVISGLLMGLFYKYVDQCHVSRITDCP